MRNPTIHRKFGISNTSGITDILLGKKNLHECIGSIKDSNIDILTTGNIQPNPLEVLGSDRMKKFINSIRDNYDYIFIDSPPIGMVATTTMKKKKVKK